jgi:hypothetical protein
MGDIFGSELIMFRVTIAVEDISCLCLIVYVFV